MGIYIKGMEMPKCCADCVFSVQQHGSEVTECVMPQGRSDYCPLVSVTEPHGRLIEVTNKLRQELCWYEAYGICKQRYRRSTDSNRSRGGAMKYEEDYKMWLEEMFIKMNPDWICDGMTDKELTHDWCEKYCGKDSDYLTPKCLHMYYHHIAMADRKTEQTEVEPKHGEWIFQECCDEFYGGAYECSICGVAVVGNHHHFCPNCGARMFAKDTNVPNKEGADDA